MSCLFGMICFHIRNIPECFFPILQYQFPNVGKVLAIRISRGLALIRAFDMLLSWILGWDTHGIQIEYILVNFGKPKNRLIPSRKTFRGMNSVPEMPNNSIP